MPDKKQDDKPKENPELLQEDQPSVEDPDGREAITHPEEAYEGNPDTSYRPGDPPPGQAMFPPDQFRERPQEDAVGPRTGAAEE